MALQLWRPSYGGSIIAIIDATTSEWFSRTKLTESTESIVDDTALANETHSGQLHLPQETDAGPLNMDTIPPSYDPAWASSGASAPPSSRPSNQITGSDFRPLPTVESLSSGNSRYIQAKWDHSAFLSPFARYFRSNPNRSSLAKELGKRAATEETPEAAVEKS